MCFVLLNTRRLVHVLLLYLSSELQLCERGNCWCFHGYF